MTRKVKWIVDSSILDRGLPRHHLPDVIREQGHEVFTLKWGLGATLPEIPFSPDDCVVCYGSHQFQRALNFKYQPGSLGLTERTNALSYLSNLPLEWFLNQDSVFTTWAIFKARKEYWFELFGGDRVFIRPNSGFKTFTGVTVSLADWDHEILGLDKTSSVMEETLIMVGGIKEILGEFRFVIADGKVIAGSEYRWDNVLDIRIDYPEECRALAQQVAEHDWQVDVAYTCDVALVPGGVKVVELNSFCCAGLYACDIEDVVRGVSEAAYREWSGENI
jgi:hypothetical protein